MPAVKHRKLKIEQTDLEYGLIKTIANPIKLSRSKVIYKSPPPKLGEHTIDVLQDLLNLGDAELLTLKKNGVI